MNRNFHRDESLCGGDFAGQRKFLFFALLKKKDLCNFSMQKKNGESMCIVWRRGHFKRVTFLFFYLSIFHTRSSNSLLP
jgi:hypothetical protein